ncbi:MAG TPA: hypothetical protein VED84_03425 [Acidimicrobiales bacterium]|nr:hypothetical protein [Acidimicrobiales bacterium]
MGLLESAFAFSPLKTVSEAVAVAAEIDPQILIERQGRRYRWSFATKDGAYALLDKAARFLGIDQIHLLVGFRTLDDGTCVLHDDRVSFEPSDDSALITFKVPSSESEVAEQIRERLPTKSK